MNGGLVGKAALITGAGNGIGYGLAESLSEQRASRFHAAQRRFIRVQGRGVHYVRAGEGSPVVLLHSALSSARRQLPLLKQLASDHTVFAFDIPGFGDSDPLQKRNVSMADAADALQATLVALRVPRCPVYGSHTGGAVAIALARRHPARISALIVEGTDVFSPREAKLLLADDYRPPVMVSHDGSHLLDDWMKTRDFNIWFPWYKRAATNRLPGPLPAPDALHDRFLDRLRAGNGYQAIYGAVFKQDFCAAMMALTVPATFMDVADSIVFRHLDRLPKPKPNQRIRRFPADGVAYLRETARVIRDYRVQAQVPAEVPFRPSPGAINRRYVDLPGGQILVRSAGEASSSRPLLLLHEGRASSRVFEPLMRVLAHSRAIYAPDMPDNGSSDSLSARRPGIGHYADAVADTVAALRLGPCDIYAVGAGATVALDLLPRLAFAKARVLLEAPDFYTPLFARRLARDWAPPMAPAWDGSHLNRLWLMLRDEYAFWPWYDKSPAAACAVDAPIDWHELHARVTDILRSLPTYHRLTVAALRYDWMVALRRVRKRSVTLAATANDPRRPHTEAAVRLARLPEVAVLPTPLDGKAREILRLLRG